MTKPKEIFKSALFIGYQIVFGFNITLNRKRNPDYDEAEQPLIDFGIVKR